MESPADGERKRKRELDQVKENDELVVAAESNALERIRGLLQGQVAIAQDSKDKALCTASSKGFVDVARCLIDNGGATVLALDRNLGETPLHLACRKGHFEMAVLLAKRGGQKAIDRKNMHGNEPYRVALSLKRWQIASYLLKTFVIDMGWVHKPQPRFARRRPPINYPLLVEAVRGNHEDTVLFLLKHGANPNIRLVHRSCLHIACSGRQPANLKLLKTLVDYGANVNARNREKETPLMIACKESQRKEVLLLLLEAGASTGGALFVTIHCYHKYRANRSAEILEIAELLFDHGATVSGSAALRSACDKGLWDLVRLLVAKGADVNGIGLHGETPLITACQYYGPCTLPEDIVLLLIGAGANVNAQESRESRETSLHKVVRRKNASLTKLLLANGADLNIQNCDGETALYQAVVRGCEPIINLLLEGGANMDMQCGSEGFTVLHFVCRNMDRNAPCYMSCFETFLKRGANVNAQDKNGNSPLLLTLRRCQRTLVLRLLGAGAELHHRNNFGDNALSTAAVFPAYEDMEACRFVLDLDESVLPNQGPQALVAASLASKKDIVRFLLQAMSEQGMINANGVATVADCPGQCGSSEYFGGTYEAWWDREEASSTEEDDEADSLPSDNGWIDPYDLADYGDQWWEG